MGQQAIREEARERIVAGKKLTKAQATALGRWAFVEAGAMAGQDEEFPNAFDYAGVDMSRFRMYRQWGVGSVKPKKADLENHERVSIAANVAYWKAKDRLN